VDVEDDMSHTAGTYCNPLNLEYRFQVKGWAKESVREAADSSVVVYRGEYWLFPSKSGGYWRSRDLLAWTFVPTRVLPTEDYAPDVYWLSVDAFNESGVAPGRAQSVE
jgi:hypothetical protein